MLGRIAVKLIAAAWLAYVGFWREAAAAIGRQLRAAANAVVALLHLGGAVTAARAAVASAAAAAATVAVATGGAAGSTAHGAAGSASALAAAVAGEVLRLSTSVAAGWRRWRRRRVGPRAAPHYARVRSCLRPWSRPPQSWRRWQWPV